MANVMEVIVKGIDELSPMMDKIESKTASTGSSMQKNWAGIGKGMQVAGVAAVALGAGIEMLARANAPLLESTRRLADYLDIDSKAMQQLVLDTSNVTFPLKEVLAIMETGARLGLESAESLKEYANFWDMVSDATGESSSALAEAGASLKALGIAAGEEGKALAAFGFIQRNTTMDIGDFINSVGRLAPEMRELKMGVNEAAVVLGIMQKEFGMTSRVALQEFRTAVTSAGGDIEKLKEILGITGEMFDEYSRKVAESSDIIAENAQRNNELFTPMQKVQHALDELKYKMGDFIQGAANYAPLLTGMGSAMTIVGTLMKSNFIPGIIGAAKAVWAFTASILANPLTFWVGAIGLVITAIVLLWKNWSEITEWISRKIDWIVDKFAWLGDKIKWVAEKLGIYKEKTEEIIDATDTLKESTDTASESIDGLATSETEASTATGLLGTETDELKTSLEGVPEVAKKASDAIKLYASDVGEDYIQLAGKATDSWDDFYAFWEAEAARTAGEIKQTVTTVIDKMGVAHKVWTDIKEEVDTSASKPSNLYKIVDADGKTLGLQSGNILSQAQKEEGIKLIKLHTGEWKVKTTIPGGEGIALLKDKEVVSQSEPWGTGKQTTANETGWKGATNQIKLEIQAGAIQINGNNIDEKAIRKSGKFIFDEIVSQFRANNIVLQRG